MCAREKPNPTRKINVLLVWRMAKEAVIICYLWGLAWEWKGTKSGPRGHESHKQTHLRPKWVRGPEGNQDAGLVCSEKWIESWGHHLVKLEAAVGCKLVAIGYSGFWVWWPGMISVVCALWSLLLPISGPFKFQSTWVISKTGHASNDI